MSIFGKHAKKKVIIVVGMSLLATSGLIAAEDDLSCDPNAGAIKSSPDAGIILRELRAAAGEKDLPLTIRNLRGLKNKLPFTECSITGRTEACKVFTADAISFVSQGKNFSAKIFWENPSEGIPWNMKVKVSSSSTTCTYDILASGKLSSSDVAKCVSTQRCSSSGSWF